MTVQAAYRAAEAPGAPGLNGVGADSLQRTPRKWKRDAIRVLLDLQIKATPDQALQLLHEWREWREKDCREFIADEFRSYVQRRGDLLQTRSKRNHEWRTRT